MIPAKLNVKYIGAGLSRVSGGDPKQNVLTHGEAASFPRKRG